MNKTVAQKRIIILDMGSQYTQLIARRVRECNVYCEIFPYNYPIKKLESFDIAGIIISGGPAGVNNENAPVCNKHVFTLGIPILGICYGMQLITRLFNGTVASSSKREYGKSKLIIDKESLLFSGVKTNSIIWMSHGDRIESLPKDFVSIAHTVNSPIAAIQHKKKKIFAIQFHPEVTHTTMGTKILSNFIHTVCGCSDSWNMRSFIDYAQEEIRKKTAGKKVICAVSGGVDSTVTAVLLQRAIGNNLTGVFVNNGLLRKGEFTKVIDLLKKHFHVNIIALNEEKRFLEKLAGVTNPERKRKIIGREFIRVFERESKKIKDVSFLAQGTLYTDVIESVSCKGPSETIKSHHNVGGLPKRMKLKLVEPLRYLFKDEVRTLGLELGIPEKMLYRHPFPGPGLAIRIIGEIKRSSLRIVREADEIVMEEIKKNGIYHSAWQAFAVLLPIKTVGVMGDKRTYEHVIAIRAVSSTDGMTADWLRMPYDVLETISNRIINEVKGVNRVVYDISSKPPGTIEWE